MKEFSFYKASVCRFFSLATVVLTSVLSKPVANITPSPMSPYSKFYFNVR